MSFHLPDHRLITPPAIIENIGVPEFYCDGAVTRDRGDVVKILCYIEHDRPRGGVACHQNVLLVMKRQGFGLSFAAASNYWIPLFGSPGAGGLLPH